MTDARGRADEAAARVITRLERELVSMLGAERLLGAPDLGGGFRGYRVGEGSAYAPLPLRLPKLAIELSGMMVVATALSERQHHVQRAPRTFLQARNLGPYCDAVRRAVSRHAEEAARRGARYDVSFEAAARILRALDAAA